MASIFHKIKAYLYRNFFREDANNYVARVITERSLNIREVCELAVARGGADVTVGTMEHNVRLFLKEMAYQLCDAFSINAEWFTASVRIKGIYDSPNEKFNPKKHRILIAFRQGATMRKLLSEIQVEIVGVADVDGEIFRVIDIKSGSINERITPGRNLRIMGDKIKVVGDSTDTGIYFVEQDTGVRTKVLMEDIVDNGIAELLIVNPDLSAGTYMIEIVTQFSGGGQSLKHVRVIRFDTPLIV
jgi:hypothetical protein